MSYKRTILLDSLILACLTAVLILPLFRLRYLDNWPSIESLFISDARMLGEHLPHPGWQPLWYCGTRTDYIYPPALRYGTTLISRVGNMVPARAYHLYTALFYVLGIVAVYWLVRNGSASRGAAWLAATATALISPSLLFFPDFRRDSIFWIPQRLHALMAYGEGPHISALGTLTAALAVAFPALRRGRPAALAGAGALCALAVATNFYGATAIAILYPILVWSVWNGERNNRVLLRGMAIPLIAYGLSAFWLTPSYLGITMTDLSWLSPHGDRGAQIAGLVVVALYCAISSRFASRKPDREWVVFVSGAAILLSQYILGFRFLGLRIGGDPPRLVPELDLALILIGAEAAREMWLRPKLRIPLTLLVALAFSPSVRYLRHAWWPFPKAAPLENVYEYQTARWVHDHLPGDRILATGSVRFWFDAWWDNVQLDGVSIPGLLNQVIPVATWQIGHGDKPETAALWLRALGTDAVVVDDKTSLNAYHDFEHPDKFRDVGQPIHNDGHGTVIYQVPRVHPGLVRLVDSARMRDMRPIRGGDDLDGLTKYVAAVEDPGQLEATSAWRGFDEVDVQAAARQGQSVLLQETWDPAWHAYDNGKELAVRVEPVMHFMLIDVPEGAHNIQMRFETPFENRFGQVLFVITVLALGFLIYSGTSRRSSSSAHE